MGYALFPLGHRAEARSAAAVQAVACVLAIFNQVGVYQPDNIPAVRTDLDVRLIRWPSGELLASMIFRGPDPPAQQEASKGAKVLSGGSPNNEMNRWLDELIAR
jgi:hypothetical protein